MRALRQQTIYAGIVFLGFLSVVFFAFDIRKGTDAPINTYGVPRDITRPVVYAESPVRGAQNATVTIFEFADFACPACRTTEPLLTKLLQKYPDIQIVWKDFPIHGTASATAARCAHKEGYFWQYHDWLFARVNASEHNYSDGAALYPIDQDAFKACVATQAFADVVGRDFYEGTLLGITQTPTLVIGDVALEGIVSFDELERAVLQELANQRKK